MTGDYNAKPIKLLWCSPHPTHYNNYFFDHIAALEGVSFEAIYFNERLAKYPWKSSFRSTYPTYYLRKVLGVDWGFLVKRIRNSDELLIIAGWDEPSMLLMALWCSFIGRTFALFSDTPELKERTGFKQWLRKKILGYIFLRAHRFLVTGTPGIENTKRLGIEEQRILNLPFATNTDFFVPAKRIESIPKEEKIIFISSGRLDNSHKAFDVAIHAFRLLKMNHPDLSFQYIIAGEGPDRELLTQQIKRANLQEEVILKGWLEPSDLLLFYHQGEVFLHPSNFDPFPNAVLEAMSCGLPIIGSEAAGSVKDRVKEGENGYIHPKGDSEALYKKLLLMFGHSLNERRRMGENSRATALKWGISYHTHIMKNIVDDYRKFYQRKNSNE